MKKSRFSEVDRDLVTEQPKLATRPCDARFEGLWIPNCAYLPERPGSINHVKIDLIDNGF